ncbi:MAG: YfhO family protein [Lentimicrobiaceae bacterium]|jgi:hypothetical protein|nr:YfhO family protein [Lentimicrobiaceae bacterium]
MMLNNNIDWKRTIAIATAILSFICITFAYFNPLLEGKRLKQHDIEMYKGMSKEIADFREQTGKEVLWTNSMFGGMPAWQISVYYTNNLIQYVKKVVTLGFPYPANAFFIYLLGFFIFLLVLKVDVWLSMAGAIAFAFSSYFLIILGAGHATKAYAIGYMAPVIAGIVLTYRGKYLWGGLLTALTLALQIQANHLQITYYLLIIVVILGIFQFFDAVRFKTLRNFFKATGVLLIAALLGIMTYSTALYATYDYGKESMRGKPILTKDVENQTSGLDRDYITQWSYGIGETWSLMIPNAKGGESTILGERHEAMKNMDPQVRSMLGQQNTYWGDQPGTSGPVYVGAFVVFMFIFAALIVKGRWKWILLSATILSILLSWGKNWMPFTDFFLDYVPLYNKFRAVSMTLVIAEFCIPLLAFIGIMELYKTPNWFREKSKRVAFYIALGATAGITLLFYITPTTFFNFLSAYESSQFNRIITQNPANRNDINFIISQLETVRIAIFRADAMRSFLFIVIGAFGLLLLGMKKIKQNWFTAGLVLLLLCDLVPIALRYLNDNNFIPKRRYDTPFAATKADETILSDKTLDFRVLDLTKNVFNDASTSYFHKSVGGYHGAKLQRYQDIIDYYLTSEIDMLRNALRSGTLPNTLEKTQIINALNTKYFIYSPESVPIENRYRFGNAWAVQQIRLVDTPNQEIETLYDADLRHVAVINKEFESQLSSLSDSTIATITMTDYKPNHLTYSYQSETPSLVVFSEIWTQKGWNLTLNGESHPLLRANYFLRAAMLPAGEFQIEMKYEPKVWSVGQTIALISSSLLLLLLVVFTVLEIRKRKQTKQLTNSEE